MKLNIPERILAMHAVNEYKQKRNNFLNLKMIRSLSAKLLVNEEEIEKYDLKITNTPEGVPNYKWNDLGFTEEVEIEITDGEKRILIEQLVEMNNNDQLVDEHIPLCEKLVPNPEEVFKSKVE